MYFQAVFGPKALESDFHYPVVGMILDLREDAEIPCTVILPDGTETTVTEIFARLERIEAALREQTKGD